MIFEIWFVNPVFIYLFISAEEESFFSNKYAKGREQKKGVTWW